MTISQCMIVKNEEKNIRRALTWGKDIVSEQIVVDTGSEDKTVEIAKQMGAKVYFFPWNQDFAAAKNFALKKATGKWIAFLDADEYLSKEDAKKLPWLLAILEKTKFLVKGEKTHCNMASASLVQMEADGTIGAVSEQTRIFLNHPSIRYQGAIHEQITGLGGYALYKADLTKELSIFHTGYAWTKESRERKGNRNLGLLLKELEKHPDSAKLQLYIAETLSVKHKEEEAIGYAKKAIANSDHSLERERQISARQVLLYALYDERDNRENIDKELREAYREAVAFDANYPDFEIAIGFYLYERALWKEAGEHLELSLEKAKCLKEQSESLIFASLIAIYVRLSVAWKQQKDNKKAVYYGTLALQADNDQYMVLQMMLEILGEEEQKGEGISKEEEMERYLQKLYDFSKEKDLLIALKSTKLAGNAALEERLKKYLSKERKNILYSDLPQISFSFGKPKVGVDAEFLSILQKLSDGLNGEESEKGDPKKREWDLKKWLLWYERLSDYRSKRALLNLLNYQITKTSEPLEEISDRMWAPLWDRDLEEQTNLFYFFRLSDTPLWDIEETVSIADLKAPIYLRYYGEKKAFCIFATKGGQDEIIAVHDCKK